MRGQPERRGTYANPYAEHLTWLALPAQAPDPHVSVLRVTRR